MARIIWNEYERKKKLGSLKNGRSSKILSNDWDKIHIRLFIPTKTWNEAVFENSHREYYLVNEMSRRHNNLANNCDLFHGQFTSCRKKYLSMKM